MALTEDFTLPDFVDLTADLAGIRSNFAFLLVAAVNGSIVIPGWTTTVNSTSSPQNFAEPNSIVLTNTDTSSPQIIRTIYLNYTWTSGQVTQMIVQYDDGVSSPSLATLTGGTISITYDGAGNFTGATSV